MALVEAVRVALLVVGGAVALALALGPAVACRRYASAVVEGRSRRAGFWAFLAAGGGSHRR